MAKGAHLFPLQSRVSDLAGGKALVDAVQFKGYSDLHRQTSHSAGPAEAWAGRLAGSISQGRVAAGHSTSLGNFKKDF